MKRYAPLWQRFVQWCKERELPFLPSTGTVVALYLLAIAQTGKSHSSIKCNSAAIAAFHEFSSSGKVTEHPLVCAVRNYARRVLPAGENRKEPITWEKVEQANLWLAGQAQSLRNLSLATAISLGFCGFFRYDDLSHIRVNNLKLVGESLLEIRLDSRKNDQYREGSLIVLSAIADCALPGILLLTVGGFDWHRIARKCIRDIELKNPDYNILNQFLLAAFQPYVAHSQAVSDKPHNLS
ncbi:probable integrase/recombinase xerD homolog [Coccomyxa sp. Obi]|nr:probable integrase/recombinase xerD homolog [Coccomyxa sp. Obi]